MTNVSVTLVVLTMAMVTITGTSPVQAHVVDEIRSGASGLSAKNAAIESGAHLPTAPFVDPALLQDGSDSAFTSSGGQRKANQASLTRAQVVSLYNTLYVPGNGAPIDWTGSGSPTCNPGTTSATYQQHTLNRLNFFRQLAGLPSVSFFAPTDFPGQATQASSLMQGANNSLSHSPPTSWLCYSSTGATGAGRSNLGLGYSGTSVIDGYMDDNGSGNESVGHRRWILYPRLAKTFSGDASGTGVRSANTMWVIQNASGDGTWGSRASMPNGVAWPPGGFVPFQALPDVSNRWSFHWPGATFSSATVTITKNGQPVPILGYDARDGDGFGDAAIVFRPNNVAANGAFVSYASPGAVDQDYVVTVSGISGGGAPSSVTYTVTVIDPAVVANTTITGTATLSTSGNVAAGTPLCAIPAANVTCNSVSSSGQYSCSVPAGWTGTLHLQAGNTNRVAAVRYVGGVVTQNTPNFVVYPNSAFTCNLDADNNGIYDPASDGVMMLRKLFGVTGLAQTTATPGPCAQRTNASDMVTHLAAQSYDFDGGGASAHREGLVLQRLMRGLSGTNAVVGTGLSWPTVQSQINNACGTNF